MKKINLLWTGGLDSTFRLVELAHESVEIQPYYVVDSARKSLRKEQQAMQKILQLLKKKTFTKAVLHDVCYISEQSIKPDYEISNAYRFFFQFNKLGSQYDFLSKFADQNNLILEVGLENSDRSKAAEALKKYGDLKLESYLNKDGAKDLFSWDVIYCTDPKTGHPLALKLFGNLRFPAHLFNIEKVEEADLLKNWGCKDILKTTWFCHKPVLGFPCGQCNPCKDALNEGMEWRVPLTGRVLGKMRKEIKACFRSVKKFLR